MTMQKCHVINCRTVLDVLDDLTKDPMCDEPLFICDIADVISKYLLWSEKLPRIRPFYAVKAQSEPFIVQILSSLGAGFDCASKVEMDIVLSVGGKPSDIVYAHPQKLVSHLVHAADKGIDLMTFDSESELHKVKKFFPKARLLLRFGTKADSKYELSDKFGCSVTEGLTLLRICRELDLNVVGLAFHVGSMCRDPGAYSEAIATARKITDVAKDMGFSFTILDIGGGFPGHLGTYDLFQRMCEEITKSLDEHFPESDSFQVIAEPGNYFVNSSCTFYTTIIGKKTSRRKDSIDSVEREKTMYYLNDGRYGSLPWYWKEYGAEMFFLSKDGDVIEEQPSFPATVWGCSCCCTDSVLTEFLLPEMDVGDHIVIRNMGAYMRGTASTFNGFSIAPIRYVYSAQSQSSEEARNYLTLRTLPKDFHSFAVEYDIFQRLKAGCCAHRISSNCDCCKKEISHSN